MSHLASIRLVIIGLGNSLMVSMPTETRIRSEGCTIFAEIIQEGDLGNVFVRRYLEI